MKDPLQILHVEDDPTDTNLIQEILESEGIRPHISRVETQADFSASLEQGCFDLILADYSLPSFDGLSALKIALEKCPDIPFIFVSGALGEETAIEAVKGGATDYVSKERLARIVPAVQRAVREAEDRSKRKQAETALRDAQTELAHVTRVATLGELTASIAHEINQPLGAVVNNANACLRWLAAENLEEARRSVALIIADSHRASEIITRVRALAKKTPPRNDWLDINEAIREVIALVSTEARRNHIALETQLANELPRVLGDRVQLQQVMLNLINNAIEAMSGADEGPRELQIASALDEARGVVVTVQDSGPGLDPEAFKDIFRAFYSTKPQGMGMGLAICRSIITAQGGRLWATANDGRGASFQFALPPRGESEA